MVIWRIKSCPRCGGDIYVDVDGDVLFDHCLQCSYINPWLSEPCPKCGFGMYSDSDEGRQYSYCSNCGFTTKLRKVTE